MKLAQINLTRGMFIPGLGNTSKVENLECEQGPGGILVTTSTAKVLIPWDRVELVVTEWIGINPQGLAAVAAGAQAHGTGMLAHDDRQQQARSIPTPEERAAYERAVAVQGAQIKAALVEGAEQVATIGARNPVVVSGPLVQPPPPQKKGGKGR